MKLIIAMIAAALALTAQEVTLDVTVSGVKTSVTLPKAAGDAMAAFVAASGGKFTSVSDLVVKHLEESLAAVLIQRYPSDAVKAKQDAVETAKAEVVAEAIRAAKAKPVIAVEPIAPPAEIQR